MYNSFIKLSRKIQKWEWYTDGNTFRVFLHLLMDANFKQSKFKGHVLPVGSLIIGRKMLAADLQLSEQQIRTSINKLKSTNEITIKATNKFSICTIVKWAEYQTQQPTKPQQINQQVTNNQPTSNQQVTTEEEVKNIRSKERTYNRASRFDDFWSCYPKKKSKGQAESIWKRKNLGNGSFDLIMKGLESAKRSDEWHKDGGKFIPYPATWLNAKGWEDEYEESAAQIDYLSGVLNA